MKDKYVDVFATQRGEQVCVSDFVAKRYNELPKEITRTGAVGWASRDGITLMVRSRDGYVRKLVNGGLYGLNYYVNCASALGEMAGRMEQLEADKKLADAKPVFNEGIGWLKRLTGGKIVPNTYQKYEITIPDEATMWKFLGMKPPCENPFDKEIKADYVRKESPCEKPFELGDYVKSKGVCAWFGKIIEINDGLIGKELVRFISVQVNGGGVSRVHSDALEHAEKPPVKLPWDSCEKPLEVRDYVKTNDKFKRFTTLNHCEGRVLKLEYNVCCIGNTLATICVNGEKDQISTDYLERTEKPDDDCIKGGDLVCTTKEYEQNMGHGVIGRVTHVSYIPFCHIVYTVESMRGVPHRLYDYQIKKFDCPGWAVVGKPKPRRVICIGDSVRTTCEHNVKLPTQPSFNGVVKSISNTLATVKSCNGETHVIGEYWLEHAAPRRQSIFG